MSIAVEMEKKLIEVFQPEHLELVNESYMHASGRGAESHFKVVVVSDFFTGKALLARHRAINSLMQREFDAGLHALAIHAFTPDEWLKRGGQAQQSPACQGVGR